MPGERQQTVLTPPGIVRVLDAVWPEGVEMDPCSAPGQLVRARLQPLDGLAADWPDRTFVNPPYAELKRWFAHESGRVRETVWLVPVRPHRKWFRAWARTLHVIVWLDPLKFVGHKCAFPAPLMLGYTGRRQDHFTCAAKPLGGLI